MCGFQVTLLKQNIGSMGRHIHTPADKEAKVGKSDAEDKENVNYVLVNIAVHSSVQLDCCMFGAEGWGGNLEQNCVGP